MLSNKIDSIKKQVSYSIMGAYLKGVAKDTAYLGDIKIKALGESFCKFNNKEIDFSSRDLIDLSDINSAPIAGGTLNSILSATNKKISEFAESLKAHQFDKKAIIDNVLKYASKLQGAAVRVAYGEGVEDDDLKQDIRVLLKEGKNEFIKREQEEEENATPDNADMEGMPEEDLQQQEELPADEEQPTEGLPEEDLNEGEEAGDDDYQALADQEYGEGTDDEDAPEEGSDDTGIPTGSFESAPVKENHYGFETVADLESFLKNRNRHARYAESMKFYYGGELITTTPVDMRKMTDVLLEAEKQSIKAIGEAAGFDNITSDERLLANDAHKAIVNQAAVIMVTRNRYGLGF